MIHNLKDIDFQTGAVLLFNKPPDWTSFDLVNKVRSGICRKMGIKKLKVGHAGTLDPKATGLVVICTGKATKSIDIIQSDQKEYIAKLKLGATTPSFDLESEEDKVYPTSHLTLAFVSEKLKGFIGEIDQVPPVFSAIKVNGKRAFHYARKGQELELESRKVLVEELTIIDFQQNEVTIKIKCGKGTYIRSLARDLGVALNSGAYLLALCRTRIGNYLLENAWDIENFEKKLASL